MSKPKTLVAADEPEPDDWADDPNVGLEEVQARMDALPRPISLHGMTAEAALNLLKSLRARGSPVLIEAPEGRPVGGLVVDGHHYAGEWHEPGKVWWFHPRSLDMACRVAGWKVTVVGKGRLALS